MPSIGCADRSPRAPALGLALVAMLAAAPLAHASPHSVPTKSWVTNGPVYDVATTPQATYIGGDFSYVGPRTGPGAGIDAASGKSTGLPVVAGGERW